MVSVHGPSSLSGDRHVQYFPTRGFVMRLGSAHPWDRDCFHVKRWRFVNTWYTSSRKRPVMMVLALCSLKARTCCELWGTLRRQERSEHSQSLGTVPARAGSHRNRGTPCRPDYREGQCIARFLGNTFLQTLTNNMLYTLRRVIYVVHFREPSCGGTHRVECSHCRFPY